MTLSASWDYCKVPVFVGLKDKGNCRSGLRGVAGGAVALEGSAEPGGESGARQQHWGLGFRGGGWHWTGRA